MYQNTLYLREFSLNQSAGGVNRGHRNAEFEFSDPLTPLRCNRWMTLRNETVLLARARELDQAALAEIHTAYYGPLYRYIMFRVSDQHQAEDLTSEVFMRLLTALRDGKAPETTLKGWLYGVAANVVSDHHRRSYRRPQTELPETLTSDEGNPTEALDRTLQHSRLREAMSDLTSEQQDVLALRFGYEMPIREVAETMGKSEGAIKQLQARAVAMLSKKLAW